jgi:cytoskeletal protein CcmA (bactofilin family)
MDNEAHAKNLNHLLESSGEAADNARAYLPKPGSPPRHDVGESPDRRRELSVLGKTVVFKGEFEAQEDLLIDGRVEGKITHRAEHLTIGPHGEVKADIMAQRVLVQGRVVGNIHATDTIVIEPSAHVAGNLFAPRVGLKEGAEFDGRIQMTRTASAVGKAPVAETRASANAGKEQAAGERAESRGAVKRAGSAKKSAGGGSALSDSRVDDLLD